MFWGSTTTHHQERKQLYLQRLVFVTPLLLHATIVKEFGLSVLWVAYATPSTLGGVRHPQHSQTSHYSPNNILFRSVDNSMYLHKNRKQRNVTMK